MLIAHSNGDTGVHRSDCCWLWVLAVCDVGGDTRLMLFTCRSSHPSFADFDRSLELYRSVAGLCMLCCAIFYVCGGLLCFGALKQGEPVGVLHTCLLQGGEACSHQQRAEHTLAGSCWCYA